MQSFVPRSKRGNIYAKIIGLLSQNYSKLFLRGKKRRNLAYVPSKTSPATSQVNDLQC